MENQAIHSNENYEVVLAEVTVFPDGNVSDHAYDVINVNTGQREFKAETLPEAIDFAEHNNTYLVNELYKWISAKGSELKAQQDSETFPVKSAG